MPMVTTTAASDSITFSSTTTSTTTTTADLNTWILVLSTFVTSKAPVLLDGKGRSKDIGFIIEWGTDVDASCSVIWQGQMFVFGGDNAKRQIALLDKCKLRKKGELPFDMTYGACVQRDNQELFICFENVNDPSTFKNCHRSEGPLKAFAKLLNSNYGHTQSRIAVNSGEPSLMFNLVLLFRLFDCCRWDE